MKDYIEISTAPIDEPCVQVTNKKPYMIKMRQEAIRFIKILKNRFENFDGISYRIISDQHEFGPYLSIHIVYDIDDVDGYEQAMFIIDNLPHKWKNNEHFRWDIVEAVNYELAVAGVEGY